MAALHMAAQEGKVDVIKLLTDAEAKVDIQAEVHVCQFKFCSSYVHALL